MAFNFNWSPLIADTSRAREMLTIALNKSPKPPIIVDDIIVNELNLGSTPPELEILEVGDLAEDRFRGIFKMSYRGDAFLTLKTKVQANPLNTYLSTKPSFASPQPLAASAGLTIPLQITLSDIRLSGFVILVFSRQKGLTLVFQNDPLESLKVSSTFDSIPFVRDYLQKEIEGQLRVLFMEDLPAIIHRLSLRLWSPEFQELEESLDSVDDTTKPIDPLWSPPQDAVDAFGNPLNESQMNDLSFDSASEIHASFSQKNILRLAALTESQRTLSLFTPSIRDAVFRAWAGPADRPDCGATTPALTLSSLSRIQSAFGNMRSTPSSVSSGSTGNDTHSSRPTLYSYSSSPAGLSLGANRSRPHQMRKRKKRVVDLRKDKESSDASGISTEASAAAPSACVSEISSTIAEDRENEELVTPPKSPPKQSLRFQGKHGSLDVGEPSRLRGESTLLAAPILSDPPKSSKAKDKATTTRPPPDKPSRFSSRPPLSHSSIRPAQQTTSPLLRSISFDKISSLSSSAKNPVTPHSYTESATSGGILEQAWMLKMAQEIARKVQEQKDRGESPGGRWNSVADALGLDAKVPVVRTLAGGIWDPTEEVGEAPPAYVA